MKKISLLLIFILIVSVLSVFGGCKNNATESAVEMMYDFEDAKRGLLQVRPFMNFGVMEENRESEYVSEGKKSLKIMPMGLNGSTARPLLVFPTYSDQFDYNFMDFTKIKTFYGDFYNAQENDVVMEIGLALSGWQYVRSESWLETSPSEKVVLKHGWNKVTYAVPHSLIDIEGDISKIYGVYISFENSMSFYKKDLPTIYVDNLRLEKSATEIVTSKVFELDRDDEKGIYEICSFDKDYQRYMVWCGRHRTRKMQPDVEIFDPLLGEEIGKVLKFETRYTVEGSTVNPFFYIAEELIAQYDTKAMLEDTDYDYYLCIDLYNDCDTTFNLAVEYYSANKEKEEQSKTWAKASLIPHKWSKYEYNLNQVDVITGTDPITGEVSKKKYLFDAGKIMFSWDNYTSGEQRVFWMNNVRIERRLKTSN